MISIKNWIEILAKSKMLILRSKNGENGKNFVKKRVLNFPIMEKKD